MLIGIALLPDINQTNISSFHDTAELINIDNRYAKFKNKHDKTARFPYNSDNVIKTLFLSYIKYEEFLMYVKLRLSS